MKKSEKIYTAIVLTIAVLITVDIALFQMIMIPRESKPGNVQFWNFMTIIFALQLIALGTTSVWNLKRGELKTVPTIIQIIFLFLTSIGIPFAIWGIVLLKKQNKNANPSNKPT